MKWNQVWENFQEKNTQKTNVGISPMEYQFEEIVQLIFAALAHTHTHTNNGENINS